jgi:hypothetical protein
MEETTSRRVIGATIEVHRHLGQGVGRYRHTADSSDATAVVPPAERLPGWIIAEFPGLVDEGRHAACITMNLCDFCVFVVINKQSHERVRRLGGAPLWFHHKDTKLTKALLK